MIDSVAIVLDPVSTEPDAVKDAAGGLMRQTRLLERIMRRDAQSTLSSTVSVDWKQLQIELLG